MTESNTPRKPRETGETAAVSALLHVERMSIFAKAFVARSPEAAELLAIKLRSELGQASTTKQSPMLPM